MTIEKKSTQTAKNSKYPLKTQKAFLRVNLIDALSFLVDFKLLIL